MNKKKIFNKLFHIVAPAGPVVHIVPSSDVINIGDTIDLRCVFSSRHQDRPRYQWSRGDHYSLSPNAQTYENNLRITNVQMSDSGIYRCHVDSYKGAFDQEYNLIVQGNNKNIIFILCLNYKFFSFF